MPMFSPVRVAKMEVYLRQVIEACIDALIERGTADFHNSVSAMVPMTIIADQLGLPRSIEDIARFRIWSDAVVLRSEPWGQPRSIARLHSKHMRVAAVHAGQDRRISRDAV